MKEGCRSHVLPRLDVKYISIAATRMLTASELYMMSRLLVGVESGTAAGLFATMESI